MGVASFFKNIFTEVKVIKGEATKDKLYSSKRDFLDREEALRAFEHSKEKLFDVNKWSELPGISASFKLYNSKGNVKSSPVPEVGDFIYIDLPGPTPETWVKVTEVREEEELAQFTVSPSHDPREEGEKATEVEHFFADEATSTFRVELVGTTIYAAEIGKEEGINNKGKEAGGREIVNTLIAVGGWIAVQEMQWKKLTNYLVHYIDADEQPVLTSATKQVKQAWQTGLEKVSANKEALQQFNITHNPSRFTKIVVEGIISTTAMTAFSYGLSRLVNKQFREPELLSYLVHEQPLVSLTRNYQWANKTTGFLLHYLAGLGYAAGYEYLWKPSAKMPTLAKGASYGVIAGLSGAAVWDATIRMRKEPPRLEKKEYYTHLLLAHVVFGATAALLSKSMSKS